MKIRIGNNNKINNSTIGNNNKYYNKDNTLIIKLIIEIIIGIIVALISGYCIYKFGWN